jgi:ATP adenylyltransferase/5',5'''-P-1,P-4-tetraphosphate phosphorylase II
MTPNLSAQSHQLLQEQQQEWKLLRDNVAALASVRTRSIELDDFALKIQFNPARITSTAAKTDAKSIGERKCFLCDANRPPEQRGLPFGDSYLVLCNPFPIFPEHFTITHRVHRPQRIKNNFEDLLDLARAMSPRYTVFYNGPRCGASAPDHLHFQAGDRGFMTIESEYDRLKGEPIVRTGKLKAFAPNSLRPFVALESADGEALAAAFDVIYRNLSNIAPAPPDPAPPDEPMMNILAWHDGSAWRVIVLPRAKHRPSFYFADGDAKILLSPASVDLGGVCIVPLEHDFQKLDRPLLEQMLREVMLPPEPFARLRDALAAVLK